MQRLGQLIEAVYHEPLQKDDSQKNDDRRKINTAEAHGDSSSNLVKYGFGNLMNKANDGVIRVRTDP